MASSLPVIASDWNGYRDLVSHGSTGWLVPCRDLLKNQSIPDTIDQQFALGLKDYDSTVGLHSLGVVIDHNALEAALEDLVESPQRCLAMGEAGADKIQSRFHWDHVCQQYRELWKELNQRRSHDKETDNKPCWPMATSARLFKNHANQAPWKGPWEISEECTTPLVLKDMMQTCSLEPVVGVNTLRNLAEALEQKRNKSQRVILNWDTLKGIYEQSGLVDTQFERMTSVLEKIAILLPETQES